MLPLPTLLVILPDTFVPAFSKMETCFVLFASITTSAKNGRNVLSFSTEVIE